MTEGEVLPPAEFSWALSDDWNEVDCTRVEILPVFMFLLLETQRTSALPSEIPVYQVITWLIQADPSIEVFSHLGAGWTPPQHG